MGKFSLGRSGGRGKCFARGVGTYSQVETTRAVHQSQAGLKPGPDFFFSLVCVFAVMLAATLWRECV